MADKSIIARYKKWSLTLKIIPLLILVILLKYAVHYAGLEIITSNPYLPSIIAATVFLIGFLISGVLTDFKESEKIPGELAASMESLADEAYIIYRNKKSPAARDFLEHLRGLSIDMESWFYKKIRTRQLLERIRGFNDYFSEFEQLTQPAFVSRMKSEQHALRRMIMRVHTIMDTSFIPSGYAIAEGISALLILAMILTKFEPFLESMVFMVPVAYLLIYMIALIKDLDNPFQYDERGETTDEVSLKEIHDETKRLDERIKELDNLKKK
jgi:hypothetical protein